MATNVSKVTVPVIPVIVKKGNTIPLLKGDIKSNELLLRHLKSGSVSVEQVIYKSKPNDFLRGEYPDLTLLSRSNVANFSRTTIARFKSKGSVVEKSSKEIVKIIGQKNYDLVFTVLSSVISEELRIRALLALLSDNLDKEQADSNKEPEPSKSSKTEDTVLKKDAYSQTYETATKFLEELKQRRVRRIRRQQKPYIVSREDGEKKLKRVVIDPEDLATRPTKKKKATEVTDAENFPELKGILNEDSNFSDSSVGNISLTSQHSVKIPQLLHNPNVLLESVDQHTAPQNIPLTLSDGSVIMVCAKPMDKFHWATPEILKTLNVAERNKLLCQQAIIDWTYCLERDEDGYLPIHQAVMANDLDFLNRQCSALRNKYGTIDLTTNMNMYSQTALQMSIYKDGERCTALLLRHGSDPRLQDDEGKSFFHTAAEVSPEHLTIALEYCRENARQILKDDDELWDEKMEDLSDKELAQILLDNICSMCDNQGYTPLMLASKQGNPSSARLLVQASPHTVNMPMPNCGSTALYLAVAAACMEATNSSNHTKVPENFLKTIEILVENGADPSIDNHSGSSVNTLLMEYHRADLSVLIANNLTSMKLCEDKKFTENDLNSYMLVRNRDGKLDVAEIWAKTKTRKDDISNEDSKKASGKCASGTESSKNASDKPKTGKIASFTVKSGKNASVGKRGAGKKTLTVLKKKLEDVPRQDPPKYVKILPKPTQVKDTKPKKIVWNLGKTNEDKATKRRNEPSKKVQDTKKMKVTNDANTSTDTGNT